jgi:hypothetical protein
MMTDQQRNEETDVGPQGAVEVDESALDQAAGGLCSNENVEGTFVVNKLTGLSGQEGLSQGIAAAGPGAGPHLKPGKKI